MPRSTPSRSVVIAAAVLLIILCAYAAALLVDWRPDAKGLPSDVAAIQEPGRRPATAPVPALPRQIKPGDLPLD